MRTQGQPVFVNYRSDEMEQASRSVSGAVRSHGMPPYSPIRIRSGRGGGRLSLLRRPVDNVPRRSGFPVSNRGRRAASLPNRSAEDSSSIVAAAETCLKMLQTKRHTSEVDSPPRSVLKRRLPLASKNEDADEIKTVLSHSSSSSTESASTSGSSEAEAS
jgi:hypothetical protein